MEYNMEHPVRTPYMSLNYHGDGKTLWITGRARFLIDNRDGGNLLRIVGNVFRSSLNE